MALACKHPPLPDKPGSNWVQKQGGLPKMIDCVARAIYHTGRSQGDVSKAVQLAVGAVENWASGQGKVKPQTRAQAAAAVAEFKAKAASSKAETAAKNLSGCGCESIDLATAFDETKHRRVPKGSPGGGRFMALVSDIAKLKQGESHTVHAASGTRVKRITATRLRVEQGTRSVLVGSPHEAARKAVQMAAQAKPVRRSGRPGVTNLSKGAMPGGRFPIQSHADVKKAVRAVGRARPQTPQERAKVRRHIMSRAKAIGAGHLIPDSWKASGALNMAVVVAPGADEPETVNALLRQPGAIRSRARIAAKAMTARKRVRRKAIA